MTKKKKKAKGDNCAVLGHRPTRYRKEHDDIVYKLCLLNAIDTQIADVLMISERTLNIWKEKHPAFMQSIKRGKEQADAEVAKALFHRACGYSHPEEKIFCNQVATRVEKGIGDEKTVTTSVEQVVTRVPTIKQYPPDTAAAFIWLKNRAGWKDKTEHVLEDKRTYTPKECDVIRKLLAGRCVNADS